MMLKMLIHFRYLNHDEAKNILRHANLNEKIGSL